MEMRRRVVPGASPVLTTAGRGRGVPMAATSSPSGAAARSPQLPLTSMATAGGPKGSAASAQRPFPAGQASGASRSLQAMGNERGQQQSAANASD